MDIFSLNNLLTFALCSYSLGWALNSNRARRDRFLDLCTFVRQFMFAPPIIVFAGIFGTMTVIGVVHIIIPNILTILGAIASIIGLVIFFYLLGSKILKPVMSKAYYGVRDNVLEPISDKICIVMYKEKSKSSYE